jgi:hypothetical protein
MTYVEKTLNDSLVTIDGIEVPLQLVAVYSKFCTGSSVGSGVGGNGVTVAGNGVSVGGNGVTVAGNGVAVAGVLLHA